MRQELALVAARVGEDLEKVFYMLHSGNTEPEPANEVMESGKIIDKMQPKIEDMALVLIAT